MALSGVARSSCRRMLDDLPCLTVPTAVDLMNPSVARVPASTAKFLSRPVLPPLPASGQSSRSRS
jgi:hypothetical protein